MSTITQLRTLLEEAGAHDVPEPRAEFLDELESFLVGDVSATADMHELLEEAADRDAPTPRPEFVAGLEARLLQDAHTIAQPIPLVARSSRRARPRVIPALASAAAVVAALVLAGSLTGVFGTDPAQRQLQLTSQLKAATGDTQVVLPSGKTVDPTPGQQLPEGTQVRTGENGSATVGNVQIGPNQVATVTGGNIQVGNVTVPVPSVTVTTPTVPAVPGVSSPLTGG
jgi:hypothetical protein